MPEMRLGAAFSSTRIPLPLTALVRIPAAP
jgi:hypothetical protein